MKSASEKLHSTVQVFLKDQNLLFLVKPIAVLLLIICIFLLFQLPSFGQVTNAAKSDINFDTLESPLLLERTTIPSCPENYSLNPTDYLNILSPLSWFINSFDPYNSAEFKAICSIFNKHESLEIGKIIFSKSIVSTSSEKEMERFRLWHISVPIVIKPSWKNYQFLSRGVSRLGLDFSVKDVTGRATAQVLDILPNTVFEDAAYGAKLQGELSTAVTLGRDNKWINTSSTATSKVDFWWNWNPKINVVSSGASGSQANLIMGKKPDNTGWVGKIPVELLLMVPKEDSHYVLDIVPYIALDGNGRIETVSISPIDIYLFE